MLRRRLPHGTRVVALCALLGALVASGCGGDDETASGPGPGPAAIAPADAVVYAEALVRPSGDVEAGARAALRKALLVDDPGAELRRLIDRGLADSDLSWTPTFEDDIEPWLGDRIGLFVLVDGPETEDPNAAFAFAVRDRDALDEELERLRDDGELRAGGSSGGVDYDVTRGDEPVGVVEDFLVLASSERIFAAAVDAARDGGLADSDRYEEAVDEVDDEALAFVFADPQTVASELGETEDVDPDLRRALRSSQLADAEPVVASVTASADEIAFETSAASSLVGDALDGGDSAVTVGELPGDAWLALATPPLGPAIRQALDAAGVLDEAAAELRRGAGLQLGRDLLDVLGGLGVFARGTSPLAVGAGVLLRTTSAAGANRLVAMVQSLLAAGRVERMRPLATGGARGFELAIQQLPQAIVVLARGAEVAAGYPASSAQDLLAPQQRFDQSSAGRAAIDTLGEGFEPSFVLLAPPLADLLRSLHDLQIADLSDVLRYMSAYESLAIGTQRDDDRTTVRGVLALR